MLKVFSVDGDQPEVFGYERLLWRSALNKPGGWSLTLPFSHPVVDVLSSVGSGITVDSVDGVQRFVGFVAPSDEGRAAYTRQTTAGSDSVTFEGGDALAALWWRVVVPPAGLARFETTAAVSTAVAALIRHHIGTAAGGRSVPGFSAVDNVVGPVVTVGGRYEPVGKVAAAAVQAAGLWLSQSRSGTSTVFEVKELVDTGRPVSLLTGNVDESETSETAAKTTFVYALGQGEGAARAVSTADVSDGDPWRRVESVLDRRDITTVSGLAAAAAGAAVRGRFVVDIDYTDTASSIGVGDLVSVIGAVGDPTLVPVAEVVTTVTPRGETAKMALGDPTESSLDTLVEALRGTPQTRF